MKGESENYQIVSIIAIALLIIAVIVVTIGNLSHALNIAATSSGSVDEGYVIDAGEPQ